MSVSARGDGRSKLRLFKDDRCVLDVFVFTKRPLHGDTFVTCSGDGVFSALRRASA